MKLVTAHSTQTDALDALLAPLDTSPHLIVLYGSEAYDLAVLRDGMREKHPTVKVVGATSCLGVMTEEGFHTADGVGVGLLAFTDADGSFGVAGCDKGSDPRDAARQATEEALDDADRIGEMPAVVWISAAPGDEEAMLAGVADVLGPDVPVVGGSAADNTVAGNWHQITNDARFVDGVTVTVLFPSEEVTTSFASGHVPSPDRGRATRVEGRELLEIDGEPAATVYNRWTNGAIDDAISGGVILAESTLTPLGRNVGTEGDVDLFTLSHPERVTERGGLCLFTDIDPNEEFVLMRGTLDSLVQRAGRVADDALAARSDRRVAGALVVYCAGCMLAVQDRMERVVDGLRTELDGAPFLGVFTFGEQGRVADTGNHHGNLMISVTAFGTDAG